MNRGTGHITDHIGESERIGNRPLTGLVGAARVPAFGDVRKYSPVVLDQTISQACVWFGVSMAEFMRGQAERELGISDGIPFPSIMQAWIFAQWQAQKEAGVYPQHRMAINQGSILSAGLRAQRDHGIASEDRWPWDTTQLTTGKALEVPIDVDGAAIDALLKDDYGASSAEFPLVARAAMNQLHFPVQAFDVCQKFLELRGREVEYRGPEDRPIIGRHLMLCVGWRPGYILFKNSYGVDWGDGGYVWVSDDYTSSIQARDGAVITAAPPVH